jgi:hypothetical protein
MLGLSTTLSVGNAYADVTVPPVVAIDGVPSLDPTVALDTAKKTACTPKGTSDDFDTWSGALEARVNTDPLGPTIQYVWDTFDGTLGDWGGSALAWVPDTGCAQGVRVTSQIVDTSAARNCRPIVSTSTVSAYSHLHWQLDDGTNILVGLNPDPFQLPVTYYGDDGSSADATTTVDNELPPADGSQPLASNCVRWSSVVTVTSNGYYLNNLNNFVWFACERDEYQITATPTGPQIRYVDTVKC